MNRLHSFAAAGALRGFSIIELMVGMAVGLVATVVVAQVLTFSEGQKRSTTSGGDAQVSGALALFAIQRDLELAGYGFSSSPGSLGCALAATFNGVAPVGFPATLAPVVIQQGLIGAPDTIRVLSSSKASYSVPTRVVVPGYVPGALAFPVVSPLGISSGDLLVAVVDAAPACDVFQATADAAAGSVPRADAAAGWNANGFPATNYVEGSVLINLGQVAFHSYSITAANDLQLASLDTATNSSSAVDLQANVVTLKGMYGKDTDGDNVIDLYDNITPVTNAQWQQVKAIRVAVVARSTQYEKEAVTSANPQWEVGSVPPVTGADCSSGKCLVELKVDGVTGWDRYRYKVFETVVPLRNMLWTS